MFTPTAALPDCLLGLAVGDAMGVPMENLSPRRIARLFPNLDRPRFVFDYGMGSDDTEHACMTAASLPIHDHTDSSTQAFRSSLAWRLRWWLLSGPAGIGHATLKACVKLWLGFPSTKSGVWSAGNGPAMRSPVLGVAARSDAELADLVRASTRVTHTDPKAEYGALAVAVLARLAAKSRGTVPPTPDEFLAALDPFLPTDEPANELRSLLRQAAASFTEGKSVGEFATGLGLARGVTGYMYHTVPVAVFAFFRHADDYRAAVESTIRCGGDTDTVAAIAGAMVASRVGKDGIPAEWLNRYRDWPWSKRRIERLGHTKAGLRDGLSCYVADARQAIVERLLDLVLPLPRNLFFFAVVMAHVVRRMLPPY